MGSSFGDNASTSKTGDAKLGKRNSADSQANRESFAFQAHGNSNNSINSNDAADGSGRSEDGKGPCLMAQQHMQMQQQHFRLAHAGNTSGDDGSDGCGSGALVGLGDMLCFRFPQFLDQSIVSLHGSQ
jgi:hypothetical protein